MSDTVIKVENLSKRYRIGELHKQTGSFREKVTNAFSSIAHSAKRKMSNPISPASQTISSDSMPNACPVGLENRTGTPCLFPSSSDDVIWALRNVSFDVRRGEIVGIIGRNGAGKTTILKILSRITKPTKGQAWIYGRVGSLLEVGTGFHPELTGRENIYLNGAILGMNKAEICKKFDEIVTFAEIEKFIDTPVKRYSSGMYVRLAFSVAAHLEPEILLVDEVLAVGDVEFQTKCLGKMQDVSGMGRTVLFVSHNMNAIQSLCSRSLLVDHGTICRDSGATTEGGGVKEVISSYLDSSRIEQSVLSPAKDAGVTFRYLRSVSIKDNKQNAVNRIAYNEHFSVEIVYRAPANGLNYIIAARITNATGNILFTSWDRDWLADRSATRGNNYLERCIIPEKFLKPGKYIISIFIRGQFHGALGELEDIELKLEVTEQGYSHGKGRLGLIAPQVQWEFESQF